MKKLSLFIVLIVLVFCLIIVWADVSLYDIGSFLFSIRTNDETSYQTNYNDYKNANKVEYLSSCKFYYEENNDEYIFYFALEDSKDNQYTVTVNVDIQILNGNTEVYSKTHKVTHLDYRVIEGALIGRKTVGVVTIPRDNVNDGINSKGTMKYTIYCDYFSFKQGTLDAYDLPIKEAILELPQTPHAFEDKYDSGELIEQFKLTNISYKFNYGYFPSLEIYLSYEKTFDIQGNNRTSSIEMPYKIYDSSGSVVYENYIYTKKLVAGENVISEKETLYFDFIPGETYTLKFVSTQENEEDKVKISFPDLPYTYKYKNYSGKTDYKFEITDIKYKISYESSFIRIYITGEKTYDREGNNNSDYVIIPYKLYDSQGYIIKNASVYISDLVVGDKIKDEEIVIYTDIIKGETYRFEFVE